jgi:hypothetical protein
MTVVGCQTLDEFFDGEARGDVATAFRQHLADCARCAQKLLGRMQEEIVVGQTVPIDLDDLERRITSDHTSDHNAKLSRTQMLTLITQIREFRTVMREVGADLAENFVGADAEERYGLQEHGKRLLRAAGDQAPAHPTGPAP